jgi:Tfp pilus assembly PilM family ATPase
MGKIDMLPLLKNRVDSWNPFLQLFAKSSPIGVDIGADSILVAQLESNTDTKGVSLMAGGSKIRPDDVKPGSVEWQRWAIEAIRELTGNGRFRGKDVIAAVPAAEIFIDHVKMSKAEKKERWEESILSKVKQKLPAAAEESLIKYIPTEDDNVMVLAAEHKIIDRHLAIYENAGLQIKSIAVWPAVLANCYVRFFGRRKTDLETIVMLVDIKPDCTDVVICRHRRLLFARSIQIGAKQLAGEQSRLVTELRGCKEQFGSMQRKARIERLIFLSGQAADRDICAAIAKQLQMPAQMGDCLAAVEVANPACSGIDRRGCQFSWAAAFGLSLS